MTEDRSISLSFRGGTASLSDLRTEISSALKELSDPSSNLASQAAAAGFTSSEFVNAEASVRSDAKGFSETLILITIAAPAITHALNKVWDDIVWPRIKSRLGADALGEAEKPNTLGEAEKSDK